MYSITIGGEAEEEVEEDKVLLQVLLLQLLLINQEQVLEQMLVSIL